jgi:DNA-binding response OmpR family regulator
MINLWLDDARNPISDSYVWVKTVEEAIEIVKNNEIEFMSLDHDLGPGKDGYDFVRWIVENKIDVPLIRVHSFNSSGKDRMEKLLRENGYKVI